MKLGIVDMEANFVPEGGSQMGLPKEIWLKQPPIQRLSNVLDVIKRSNFDYLELGVPWINQRAFEVSHSDISKLINSYGLKVNAFCSLMPSDIKIVGPSVDISNISDYLNKVFSICSKLGGDTIVLGSGGSRNIPEGYSKAKAKEDMVTFLKLADDIISQNKYDLKIAIEPLNSKECNFIHSLQDAFELADLVNSSNIGITLDIFHAYRQEVPYLEELDGVIKKVFHIHLSQPEDRKWPGHLNPALNFDFKSFFKKLRTLEYQGNISVECAFSNLKDEIGQCHSFLRKNLC
jgi:sugar phosphate isomerase/epimerase